MLPFTDKTRPTVVFGPSDNDDLETTAKKRAMSRFMNAVQAQNVDDALDAFNDLKELCE